MTVPEAMLWQQLRAKKLGFKVRRQHPVGPYVVDFFVSQHGLVIEIDGEVHNCADRPQRDAIRDRYLIERGYQILRVPAPDVMNNIAGVLEGIVAKLETPLHHASHGPPPQIGEDL